MRNRNAILGRGLAIPSRETFDLDEYTAAAAFRKRLRSSRSSEREIRKGLGGRTEGRKRKKRDNSTRNAREYMYCDEDTTIARDRRKCRRYLLVTILNREEWRSPRLKLSYYTLILHH